MGMETSQSARDSPSLELCLEFTDTIDWRTSEHAKDTIERYSDLLAWSRRKGLLAAEEAERLGRLVVGKQEEAVLAEARGLRESVYRIFSAAAHGRKADSGDIKVLNENLRRALERMEVRPGGEGYYWGWREGESPDMMLLPIARSAADLLTSEDLARVKECANEEEGCGSLFLDGSKSQSRKWCSMKSCGNRMKFRTYYDKHVRAKSAV